MSSERYETLEEDLTTLLEDLKLKLMKAERSSNSEEKKRLIRDLEQVIEDGHITIQEMNLECRKAPPSYRTRMTNKVNTYRKDLDRLVKDVKNLASQGEGEARPSLIGYNPNSEIERLEAAQRGRLAKGSDTLNRTSDSIARSQVVAVETEQIGEGIVDELGGQRESLLRTRDRLVDTEENLSRSRKILRTMYRRVMTNKLILAVIIVLEVFILGGLTYWKFFT